MNLGLAFKLFVKALRDDGFAERARPLLQEAPKIEKAKPSGEPFRLIRLLQRDARLIDFLLEDITNYTDDQVGGAVRGIHRDSRSVIEKYLTLAPVATAPEESTIELPVGFDPTQYLLSGKVGGSPPYRGTVVHRGWRVQDSRLPDETPGMDPWQLAPAEVEVL